MANGKNVNGFCKVRMTYHTHEEVLGAISQLEGIAAGLDAIDSPKIASDNNSVYTTFRDRHVAHDFYIAGLSLTPVFRDGELISSKSVY